MNYRQGDVDLMEMDNRARAERLASKLAYLKSVAVDIEHETRDHIPLLDEADSSLQRVLFALGSGRSKVLGLLNSNRRNRSLFCYTIIIVMILMFIAYQKLIRDIKT